MRIVARLSFLIVVLLSVTIAGDANADQQLRCAVRGTSCATECAAIQAPCVSWSAHPHGPKLGVGDLYACKNGRPTWTCSYQYKNGSNCTFVRPIPGLWFCSVNGGKQETSE